MGPVNLKIDQLLLDSENPRLLKTSNQRDVLQKILDDQGEKLFQLAQDIHSEGLSPIDTLLVLKEKKGSSRFIVLEGNRRLAALKFLANPTVLTSLHLKSSLQKRFETLAKTFKKSQVEPIRCFEVPNREEGAKWIYLRHTGENEGRGVVGWTGLATSRFRGTDPALQALDFVKQFGELTEDQKQKIDTKFPITTLDRLLSTRDVRQLIGIDVKNRKLLSGLPPEEILKPLKRIILDLVQNPDVNVSALKNKASQVTYIKGFDSSDKPDLSKVDNLRAIEEINTREFKAKPNKKQLTKRRTPDLSDRKTLVPSKTNLNIVDPKVATIFKELKQLKIDNFPNSAAVLFRVFLDLSVDYYMDTHSLSKQTTNKNNQKNEKKLSIKVGEVVDHLVEHQSCNRRDFKSIIRSLSVRSSPLSIDLFHDYIHNRFVTPKTRELIAAWDDGRPFFERIWL